jgi:hypothetical protein
MFLELTYKAGDKAVLINMGLVRYVYPMADGGSDLIFDHEHQASVTESVEEIRKCMSKTPTKPAKVMSRPA